MRGLISTEFRIEWYSCSFWVGQRSKALGFLSAFLWPHQKERNTASRAVQCCSTVLEGTPLHHTYIYYVPGSVCSVLHVIHWMPALFIYISPYLCSTQGAYISCDSALINGSGSTSTSWYNLPWDKDWAVTEGDNNYFHIIVVIVLINYGWIDHMIPAGPFLATCMITNSFLSSVHRFRNNINCGWSHWLFWQCFDMMIFLVHTCTWCTYMIYYYNKTTGIIILQNPPLCPMQVDAMIVGSHFKQGGKWFNDLDKSRVEQFMSMWASQWPLLTSTLNCSTTIPPASCSTHVHGVCMWLVVIKSTQRYCSLNNYLLAICKHFTFCSGQVLIIVVNFLMAYSPDDCIYKTHHAW